MRSGRQGDPIGGRIQKRSFFSQPIPHVHPLNSRKQDGQTGEWTNRQVGRHIWLNSQSDSELSDIVKGGS